MQQSTVPSCSRKAGDESCAGRSRDGVTVAENSCLWSMSRPLGAPTVGIGGCAFSRAQYKDTAVRRENSVSHVARSYHSAVQHRLCGHKSSKTQHTRLKIKGCTFVNNFQNVKKAGRIFLKRSLCGTAGCWHGQGVWHVRTTSAQMVRNDCLRFLGWYDNNLYG